MSSGHEPVYAPPDDGLFRCRVERDGNVGTVRAIGELDMEAVPALSAELAQLREAGCSRVIIDLRELSFLDSSGLRLLLDCYAQSRQGSHTLALIPGSHAVQRVFELTRTAEHLPFIAPALRDFRSVEPSGRAVATPSPVGPSGDVRQRR